MPAGGLLLREGFISDNRALFNRLAGNNCLNQLGSLLAEERVALDGCMSTDEIIRDREELAEQERALQELVAMAAKYGFDISRPAATAREAVQWLYFGYLAAVKEQNGAAMSLALLCTISMVWMSKLEAWLPSRQAVAMTLRFDAGYLPVESALRAMASERGFDIAGGTITITLDQGEQEWRFVAVARNRHQMVRVSDLAAEMAQFKGVKSFHLAYARN